MIHRVYIQNFKSIKAVTVDLSPVTVLVGKSGTGKSNFVESLRFLRDVLSSPEHSSLYQQNWGQVRPAIATGGPTQFEVEFSIAGIEDRFLYKLSLRQEGPQHPPLHERLDLGDKCLFDQAAKGNQNPGQIWKVAPELTQVPQPGAIAIGRIPAISEVVIAYTALTSGIGCYVFAGDVLCENNTNRVSVRSNDRSTGLNDLATNFLDTLKEIASNLEDLSARKSIVSVLKRVNPSIASVELDDIQRPSHVVVGHKFNSKTLPLRLSQESAGFRRFYAHLLALYQRPPKQILIFEHPEDGIHPGALSLLADEFKLAPEQRRGQIILTTHSPKLLDHFDADEMRVVELADSHTEIGLVSDEQREALKENLLDAGELLTVDPARM